MPNHIYLPRMAGFFASVILLQCCFAIGIAKADTNDTNPSVVASIKPLHGLVAAVSDGVFEPELLVGGNASPHTFQLKPSQVKQLANADIIVWAGEGIERFLPPLMKKLAPSAISIELADLPDVVIHHSRSDDHDKDDHGHGNIDYHLWLAPSNASILVDHLAEQLSKSDPDHADQYLANAESFKQDLALSIADIKSTLADVQGKQYLVYHDSLQYFEKAFGLGEAMVITTQPQMQAGAKRLKVLRGEVQAAMPGCIFSEPQFRSPALKVLASDLNLQAETIDPLASSFESGAQMYTDWMKQTARSIADCLHKPE